jgi:hypothetical protein
MSPAWNSVVNNVPVPVTVVPPAITILPVRKAGTLLATAVISPSKFKSQAVFEIVLKLTFGKLGRLNTSNVVVEV